MSHMILNYKTRKLEHSKNLSKTEHTRNSDLCSLDFQNEGAVEFKRVDAVRYEDLLFRLEINISFIFRCLLCSL